MTIDYVKGKTEQSVINRLRRQGFVPTTIRRTDTHHPSWRKDLHEYCVHYHKRR
jgi:hypothetical protein